MKNMPEIETCFSFGNALHFTCVKEDADIHLLTKTLQNKGFLDIRIEQIQPDIEDRFIRLSGN
jgi:hypothetical protein